MDKKQGRYYERLCLLGLCLVYTIRKNLCQEGV